MRKILYRVRRRSKALSLYATIMKHPRYLTLAVALLMTAPIYGQQYPSFTSLANDPKANNAGLTKIYNRAISDYITEVHKQGVMAFDTLFFGKRNNGQPDDFPDIALAKTIKNIKIRLVDPDIGKKLQEEKRSRVYINLMGWVDKNNAKFIFVTFSNGFGHKFDCYIDYKYNSKLKEFDLTGSRIEIFGKK